MYTPRHHAGPSPLPSLCERGCTAAAPWQGQSGPAAPQSSRPARGRRQWRGLERTSEQLLFLHMLLTQVQEQIETEPIHKLKSNAGLRVQHIDWGLESTVPFQISFLSLYIHFYVSSMFPNSTRLSCSCQLTSSISWADHSEVPLQGRSRQVTDRRRLCFCFAALTFTSAEHHT